MNSSGFPGAETSISIRGVGTFGNGDASDIVYNEYKSFLPKFNDGGQTNTRNSYTETRSKNFMWMTDYLLYFDKTSYLAKHHLQRYLN